MSTIPRRPGDEEPLTEEDATFTALRRAVVRPRGFALLLAVCNEPVWRRELTARLRDSLPRGIVDLHLTAECQDVLAEVLKRTDLTPTAPLVIEGLEAEIGQADFTHPRIASLNHRREEWRDRLPCAVIFWVPEYLLAVLARGAPDFMDWRSGTFLFLRPVDANDPSRFQPPIVERDSFRRLSKSELMQRIGQLRQLIATYGQEPNTIDFVDGWLRELADHLTRLGEWDEALAILDTKLLPRAKRRQDDRAIAMAQGRIAELLSLRGAPDEALRIYREEVLPRYERLGDQRSRAVTMVKIADVLYQRGQADEALHLYQEQLRVFDGLGDVVARGMTLGKIATVLQARGQVDEPLRICYHELLPLYERLGRAFEKAVTLGRIADLQRAVGFFDEALRIYQYEALPVFEHLGDALWTVWCQMQIGVTLLARDRPGDRAAARAQLTQALACAEKLGTLYVARIKEILASINR